VDTVTIERVVSPNDEVRTLLTELDAELATMYPPEQRHGLSFAAIFEPHVRFFVARRGDVAVGCGGIALLDGFAEVKRMYVRQVARGSGVAQSLLAHLEAETRAAGLALMRLETGTRQAAAVRVYERHGFRPCEAFGAYAAMAQASIASSLFYEKHCAFAAE
jgi:putative acetyltransferase